MSLAMRNVQQVNSVNGYRHNVVPAAAVWNGGAPSGVGRRGHTVRTVPGGYRTSTRSVLCHDSAFKPSNENTATSERATVSSFGAKARDMGIGLLFGLVLIGSLFMGSGEQQMNEDIAQLETSLVAQ